MIRFKSVTFSNFMSFGKKSTTVFLDTNNVSLILGQNLDIGAEGLSKNGVGKSTIFQAIVWCMFGQGISPIKQDDFVNMINKKKMWVNLEFEVDGVDYQISRARKPAKLELFRNGEPCTLHSSKNTDEAIIEIVGMSYEVFMNTVLLTNHPENFMVLKPAAQKTFIEQLLDINLLTKRASSVKAMAKDNTVDMQLEDQQKNNIERSNRQTLANIESLSEKQSKWSGEQEIKILNAEQELDMLTGVDVEGNLEALIELQGFTDELSSITHDIDKLTAVLVENDRSMTKCINDKTHLEAGTCPRCKQSWVSEEELTTTLEQIEALSLEVEEITTIVLPLSEREDEVSKAIAAFKKAHPDLKSESQYAVMLNKIDTLTETLEQSKSAVVNPYTDQVELMKGNIQEYDDSTLEAMTVLDGHYKIMVKLLTDSKSFIRKSIIEQYVPFLNQTANKYLDALDSPHELDIGNDLSVGIKVSQRVSLSYGNLSAGEKLRVNVAIGLAFRDFIAMTTHKCNLLMVDELFDSGADANFMYRATVLLKRKDESVFMISHREEMIPEVDQVITVTKDKGFSRIEL